MKNKGYYYDVASDMAAFPKCWAYIIVGGRNTGKTYSALKDCYLNKRKFAFIKRTNDDVDLICSGSGKIGSKGNEFDVDFSPFKSINRDIYSNVRAYPVRNGIGAFYDCTGEEGQAEGLPIGYIISLNSVSRVKGFDLAECDWLIFDEFIPQPWERVNRKEGEQVMDLYKTISRDREHRGKDPLKLVCLANATSISNPVMNMLEVTDKVAEMQAKGADILYIEERGILIHIIENNAEFDKVEKESQLYAAMGDTNWGQMAFGNTFAYNDFSAIGRTSLKGYTPVCAISYKRDNFYVYQKEGQYYMCRSRHQSENIYNLNRENDQKLFYQERGIDLRLACIEGKMLFETYTMYDIIVNYKKIFKL